MTLLTKTPSKKPLLLEDSTPINTSRIMIVGRRIRLQPIGWLNVKQENLRTLNAPSTTGTKGMCGPTLKWWIGVMNFRNSGFEWWKLGSISGLGDSVSCSSGRTQYASRNALSFPNNGRGMQMMSSALCYTWTNRRRNLHLLLVLNSSPRSLNLLNNGLSPTKRNETNPKWFWTCGSNPNLPLPRNQQLQLP